MTDKPVAPRIPLLERDRVSPEVANVYDVLLKQRGVVPNMFKTLAHTPAIALGVAGLFEGAAGRWRFARLVQRKLIATRLSVPHESEYASLAHALSARQKEATEEQIEAAKAIMRLLLSLGRRSRGSSVRSIVLAANWMMSCLRN